MRKSTLVIGKLGFELCSGMTTTSVCFTFEGYELGMPVWYVHLYLIQVMINLMIGFQKLNTIILIVK